MYWAKVSKNTYVLSSGWDALVISGWTFFGNAFFDIRSYCYFWLKVRNLVAFGNYNNAHIQMYGTTPSLYENL